MKTLDEIVEYKLNYLKFVATSFNGKFCAEVSMTPYRKSHLKIVEGGAWYPESDT